MRKYMIFLLMCGLCMGACKTTADPKDLVISPHNQYMAPHKVRELRLILGPGFIYNQAREEPLSVDLVGDLGFKYGVTSKLNYIFPLSLGYDFFGPSSRNHLIVSGGLNGYTSTGPTHPDLADARIFLSTSELRFARDVQPHLTLYLAYYGLIRGYFVPGTRPFLNADSYLRFGAMQHVRGFTLEHSAMVGMTREDLTFERTFHAVVLERVIYPLYKGLHASAEVSLRYTNPSYILRRVPYSPGARYVDATSPALYAIMGGIWRY